jgi:hypothetical protein
MFNTMHKGGVVEARNSDKNIKNDPIAVVVPQIFAYYCLHNAFICLENAVWLAY